MGFIAGNHLTAVLVVIYAVLLVFYLRAEKNNDGKNGFKKATILKLTLSGIFCGVAIISYYLLYNFSHRSQIFYTLQLLIVIGLFFALGGDFFLQYIRIDEKKYKIGISLFTCTQILFVANLCIFNGVGWKEVVITIVALLLFSLLMKKQNWQLGGEQKRVTAYTILLAFMASKGFVTMLHDMTVGSVLFSVGAILFLVSDIILGIWNYNTGKIKHAWLNWITYFSGNMLIALSISPEFFTSLIY